jgi:hypothetical protein
MIKTTYYYKLSGKATIELQVLDKEQKSWYKKGTHESAKQQAAIFLMDLHLKLSFLDQYSEMTQTEEF